MKLNSTFLVGPTREAHYIVSKGNSENRYIVKNNAVAAFIVDRCLSADMDETAVVDAVVKEYDCPDRMVVERDVSAFLNKLRSIGALDG